MNDKKITNVFFKKLNEWAVMPQKKKDDAGYDLSLTDEVLEIQSGERVLAKTGLAIEIPVGFYGHISDRSGNALKKGIHCLGKIVDPSYRGEVGVILLNTSKEVVSFNRGDRIAQIIFKKYESPTMIEVQTLFPSERGEGGFGSTGA
jgi:dUTP pyrophosphatase